MAQKIPFIDLSRTESDFRKNVLDEVSEALEKNQFVGGPQVEKLESEIASYCGANHVVACANGTDALQIALRTAGIGRGDRVLVPDLTFWASVEAIHNVGAEPICLDVSRDTLHLEVGVLQQALEEFNARAVMLVHLYGWAAPDTFAIRKLCKNKGVLLIEDSAQAFGTKLQNQDLLASAEIATTSFYPAKVLGASGDAGAIFFRSSTHAAQARSVINHGRTSHYQHGEMGWNSRAGVYESIFLRHVLKNLDSRIASRRHCLATYRKELSTLSAVRVMGPADTVTENGYLSVLWMESGVRDDLQKFLASEGIGSGVIYPGPMSTQPGFKKYYQNPRTNPNAAFITRSILSLPCFPGITQEEISTVCNSLRKFFS